MKREIPDLRPQFMMQTPEYNSSDMYGRKDYCGEQNRYMQIEDLRNVKKMATLIGFIIE